MIPKIGDITTTDYYDFYFVVKREIHRVWEIQNFKPKLFEQTILEYKQDLLLGNSKLLCILYGCDND